MHHTPERAVFAPLASDSPGEESERVLIRKLLKKIVGSKSRQGINVMIELAVTRKDGKGNSKGCRPPPLLS